MLRLISTRTTTTSALGRCRTSAAVAATLTALRSPALPHIQHRPFTSSTTTLTAATATTKTNVVSTSSSATASASHKSAFTSSPPPPPPPPMELPVWWRKCVEYIRSRLRRTTQGQAANAYALIIKHPLATERRSAEAVAKKSAAPSPTAAATTATATPPPFPPSLTAAELCLQQLGLPSDELTRYRILGLHLWMLQKTLLVLRNDTLKAELLQGPTQQAIVEMHEEMNAAMREKEGTAAEAIVAGKARATTTTAEKTVPSTAAAPCAVAAAAAARAASSSSSSASSPSPSFTAGILPLTRNDKRLLHYLFEKFWLDLSPFLRDVRGELKLTKTLQEVQQYFVGQWVAMDVAYVEMKYAQACVRHKLAQPQLPEEKNGNTAAAAPLTHALRGVDIFAAALWRNMYNADVRVSKRVVYRFVYYIQKQLEALSSLTPEQVDSGNFHDVHWIPLYTLFDTQTGALKDRVLCDELCIPIEALDDNNYEAWKKNMFAGEKIKFQR